MTLSIRIPAEDAALLERAAQTLKVSKSEFVRRSIVAYAQQLAPEPVGGDEAIDARWIGRGGGLRAPEKVTDPKRRAILERLRTKHGYAR